MPDERTRSLARRIRLLSLEARYNIFADRRALWRRWANLRGEVEDSSPGTEVDCKLEKKLIHVDRCGQNIASYTWVCKFAHSSATRGRFADALMDAMYSDPLLWALHMTGLADDAAMVTLDSDGAPINFYGGDREDRPVNRTLSEAMQTAGRRVATRDWARGTLIFDDESGGSRTLRYETGPWNLDRLVRPPPTFTDRIKQEIEDAVIYEARSGTQAPPHLCPTACPRKSPMKETVRVWAGSSCISGFTGSVKVTVSFYYTCEPDFGKPDDTKETGDSGQPNRRDSEDYLKIPVNVFGRPGAFKTTTDRWVNKPKCVERGTAKPPRGHVTICLTFEKWGVEAGPNKWKKKARLERAKAFEALDSSVFECDDGCTPEIGDDVEDWVEYSHNPLVGSKYITCARKYYTCLKDAEDQCMVGPLYTVRNDRGLFEQKMRFSGQCSARRDGQRSDESRRRDYATVHPQIEESEPRSRDGLPQPEQRVSLEQDPRSRHP